MGFGRLMTRSGVDCKTIEGRTSELTAITISTGNTQIGCLGHQDQNLFDKRTFLPRKASDHGFQEFCLVQF